MARCRVAGRLNTSATANRMVTTPAAIRISRWRRRNARTRSATRRPASAKISSGTTAPTAKDNVNAIVGNPIEPVAPARTIAASTGPAHGTYSTPSASPSPKPPLPEPNCFCGSQENGFSSSASKGGKINPTPIATRATNPNPRMASCGRWRRDTHADPATVTALKLTTRPAITRYGRSDSARESLAGGGPTDPAAAGTPAAARALCAPDIGDRRSTAQYTAD